MSNYLFILAANPSEQIVKFVSGIDSQLGVSIITDQPTNISSESVDITFISDKEAYEAGFFNSSPLIKKTPVAWDKAIYVMSRKSYDFYWFCEDDVLFLHPDDAVNLVNKYNSNSSDLLCQGAFFYNEMPNWANWRFKEDFKENVLSAAFLPLCRISNRMAKAILVYVEQHGSLSFIETMFPSLARSHDFAVDFIKELRPLAFRHAPPLTFHEILLLSKISSCRVFHPVKDASIQEKLNSFESGNRLTLSTIQGGLMLVKRQVDIWRRLRAEKNASSGSKGVFPL